MSHPASPRLARRDLLRAVVAVAGAPFVVGCAEDAALESGDTAARYFPQSVASGDPRPNSVVLWTRVFDASAPEAELLLELQIARDANFETRLVLDGVAGLSIVAQPSAGGCVKIRVEALEPATTYFYRFLFVRDGERHASRTGRTRTAPDPESDETLRFAVISCQDYVGKRYHVLAHLADQTLDFVVHLGDYVYETTADPSFQSPTPDREVRFSEPDEALSLGGYLAARSLGNYRDLYRTYRSDLDLQRVHERFAMIAIPDDHEFSNDCYGAHANYSEGREDELDLERRRNADRAWFEFMPVDYAASPTLPLEEAGAFPDDLRIYRNFVFGRRLELVLTDLRRYRPDHLVPEHALPGAVFLSESAARDVLGEVPDDAIAYVDIDADEYGAERAAAREVAAAQGFQPESIAGLLSVRFLNTLLEAAGADPLDEADVALERGYAYQQLLKTQEFSSLGARYLVAERPFLALARLRFQESAGASEALLGGPQKSWFLETLASSTRTWKVWGNEYTLMRRRIDLRQVTLAPAAFQTQIVLNVEDWDGAPNERDALLRELAPVSNLVAFTGDLHAFFAGTPYASDDEAARLVEFVAGSVSSTTWLTGIQRAIAADPSLPPETALVAGFVDRLLVDPDTRPNPHIGFVDLERNGYAVAVAGPEYLETTLYLIDDELLPQPAAELGGALADHFEAVEFRVPSGTSELERRIDGSWRRWDRATQTWS